MKRLALLVLFALAITGPAQAQIESSRVDRDSPNNVTVIGGAQGGKTVIPKLDPATESFQVVDYEHHEIHAGSHYFIAEVTTLANNAVYDLQFTTPDSAKWIHFVFELAPNAEIEWYIYENVTVNQVGTTITPINNNRNSSNTSGATVAGIMNTSVSNANIDTAIAGATTLAHGIAGAGRTAGLVTRGREIILKQNTAYSFRAVGNAAADVSFEVEWYEHTDNN